ncbi:restriction endonuclease subunit S [Egbenema bharatensis]|uniref:restriction endonuclease subunit S n=1 Tax=Egbenema bharatensis TaxID=3463334 RepID=UPI003A8ADD99
MKDRWTSKTLGEVCIVERGSSPRPIEKYLTDSSDGVNWVKIGDTKNVDKYIYSTKQKITREGAEKSRRVEPGDFILSNSMSFGKPYVMATSGYVHDGWFILRLSDNIDTNFFHYLLSSELVQTQFISLAAGSVVKNISKDLVKRAILPIPPLPEQKQIVTILDEALEGIDRAIANTEKNLTNTRELFESYLNAVLSGKGRQWKETTLGKEINLLTGFAFKSSGYTDSDKSIRLLRGDNIIPGSLRWDGVKRWPESKVNEYLRYQLQEGDVVLAMDRPWIKTGLRRAQISKDDLPCLLVQRTACLRGGDNLENRFLLYLISGRAFTQHVLGSQTGLSVPHISGKQIQSFKFSKPSLREQYSIIDSLDELKSETKRLEAIYQQKLAALNELKQSILQKAFTGELTADTTNQITKAAKEVVAA